jgi:hypothetical protein
MSVSCECCVLSGKRSVRQADHSSRGVVPIVVCLSVIVKRRERGGYDTESGRGSTGEGGGDFIAVPQKVLSY